MSALTFTHAETTTAVAVRPAPGPGEVRNALAAFRAAHNAAEEARGGLTREQEAGRAALPPDVEYLIDTADTLHEALARLVGLDEIAARLTGDVSRDYAGRRPPRVVNEAVPTGAPVDWSRSGRDA